MTYQQRNDSIQYLYFVLWDLNFLFLFLDTILLPFQFFFQFLFYFNLMQTCCSYLQHFRKVGFYLCCFKSFFLDFPTFLQDCDEWVSCKVYMMTWILIFSFCLHNLGLHLMSQKCQSDRAWLYNALKLYWVQSVFCNVMYSEWWYCNNYPRYDVVLLVSMGPYVCTGMWCGTPQKQTEES